MCAARTASSSSTRCWRRGTTSWSRTTGRDERSNLPSPTGRSGRRAARRGRPHRAAATGRSPRRHRGRTPAPALRPPELRAAHARCRSTPWSFDALHLAGARAALHPRPERAAVPRQPARAVRVEPDRARPARAVPAPSRAGLLARAARASRCGTRRGTSRTRSRSSSTRWSRWQIADRVLQARARGRRARQRASSAEIARGALPPGQLADPVLAEITGSARRAGARPGRAASQPSRSTCRSTCPTACSLVGHRPRRAGRRRAHRDVLEARAGGAPDCLAATARARPRRGPSGPSLPHGRTSRATGPPSPWRRSGRSAPTRRSRRAAAESHLQALVDLFQRGMREPLPALLPRPRPPGRRPSPTGRIPAAAAAGPGVSSYSFDNEDRDAEHTWCSVRGRLRRHGGCTGAPLADEVGLGTCRSRRGSGCTRAGSGTACSPTKRSSTDDDAHRAPEPRAVRRVRRRSRPA